jgi:outer membrane protein W
MKFSTLSKAGFAASVCAALTAMSTGASAGTLQDTIFAKVEPSARDRMFFRLSYINAHVKTTTGDAYDVTGPVVARGDVNKYVGDGQTGFVSGFEYTGIDLSDHSGSSSLYTSFVGTALDGALITDSTYLNCASLAQGLGTPCGIKAKGTNTVGTMALSVGYFLDERYQWAVEAFVLAAPVKAGVYGDGKNHLNGKKIIDTKLLPPILKFGRYFGESTDVFRPYLGVAASYAVFYDTRATAEMNAYEGGGSPGDTTVKIKNVMGFGPFVGLNIQPKQSDWSVGLSVGKIRFKTEATLTTRNTVISDSSQVLLDYGLVTNGVIANGNVVLQPQVSANGTPAGYVAGQTVSATTALMCDLARAKYGNNDCSHGTFVRRSATTLDNTMIMFNVGRNF